MSMDHLVVPENKEMLKKQQPAHNDGVCQQDTNVNCENSQQPRLEQGEHNINSKVWIIMQSVK